MLNVWKKLFTGIFSEKRVLPQKVALETLSPVLITLLTHFRQKSNFSTKFWKTTPHPLPPFLKKTSNWTLFQKQIFSRRNLSGQTKTQFWQSAFKLQKTSAECLEKVLKTLIQPRKKTVYLKKPSRFVESSFHNHAETFQKKYVILLLNFTKTNISISGKSFSTAYKFPGKKNFLEKIEKDRWNANLTIGWSIVDKVRQHSAQLLKKFEKSI